MRHKTIGKTTTEQGRRRGEHRKKKISSKIIYKSSILGHKVQS